MKRLKLVGFILYLINITKGNKIDLNGNWTGLIESINFTFPARVPGGIYTDLANINYIKSNLIDQNDVKNRWIGNESVTYTKLFHATFNSTSKVILIFHGLDTFAFIRFNDHFIGNASNMFLRYVFDVEKYIKKGENILKVTFESPIKVSNNLFEEQSKNYIIPPICVPSQYKGECHVNHIRKMQASFAWDWGPAFPSMGIWKNVELIATEIFIHDITTDVYKVNENWQTDVTIFLQLFDRVEDSLEFDLTIELGDKISTNFTRVIQNGISNYTNVSITLVTPQNLIKEWWPNGYGDPNLYTLKINLTTKNQILQRKLRIGFRTVKLIQEPLTKGLSFYFQINGIPIFAKGSNYIPSSVFPESMNNETHLKDLFNSVKLTHMNMLRVWGGGVYEFDLFYNLADEYGIMIWQDFMFACSMYPTNIEFLKTVEKELLQNVRRLKNHPSIVIWAGNNENEAALYGNWYGTGSDKIYQQDYYKLYVDLIKPLIEREDLTRPFVVSSPSNGLYAKTYNYTGENPYSNLYGDTHYYNYLRNGWDIDQYPRTRFSSEYGFQSLPSIYTLLLSTNNVTNLRIDSEFINYRQHLPTGDSIMTFLIEKNFIIPRSNNSYQDFKDYIYLSQINQAVSIKIQSEFYRQSKSYVNEIGEGLTMGALYWQLNDVWQAPTWSSIDFYGNWKMLHYYAIEFFSPVIVTTSLSIDRKLKIFVVSDILQSIENSIIEMAIYKWTDLKPIHSIRYDNVSIVGNKGKLVTSIWLDDALEEYGCGSSKIAQYYCIISLTLKYHNGTRLAPTNYVYPTSLKYVNLPLADVHMKFKETDSQTFQIDLSTSNITLFVWLEMKNIKGRFSKNGFHMFDNNVTITYRSYVPITLEILRDGIEISNLSDLYNDGKQRRQMGGK